MKIKLSSFFNKVMLALFLLGMVKTTSFAAFPPVLVIAGAAYPGTEVDGSGGDTYFKYTTSNSVVLLHGATGGVAAIGADETSALNSPTTTGTWDGGSNVYLTGTTVVVPQVLVYYPAAITPAVMQGYDGNQHQAVGSGSANGEFVVAYSSLPNGYIFNFGTSPIYRYQAGTSPVTIDTTNGWPAPNVFIFPSQVTYGGETLNVNSYTCGMTNGYWANAYYATTDGTNIYGQLHAYIPSDGSAGQLYGDVNGSSVSAQWDSTTHAFVASPWLGVDFATPSSLPSVGSVHYGPPQIEYNGELLPFAFNDVNGSDVYWNASSGNWIIIDSSDSVTINGGSSGTYFPGYQIIGTSNWNDNIAAVSADGYSFLDSYACVEAYGLSSVLDINSGFSSYYPTYYYTQPNGKIAEDFSNYNGYYSFNNPFVFGDYSYDNNFSPTYSGLTTIDATNGWPAGNVPSLPVINQISINGQGFHLTNFSSNGVFEGGDYLADDNSTGFEFYALYGGPDNVFDMVCNEGGNSSGVPTDFIFTSNTLLSGSGYSLDGSIYFSSPPPNPPSYGPARILWHGVSYGFTGNLTGSDTYVDTVTGHKLYIDSSYHLAASADSSVSGTYTPGTYAFTLSGMVAQDGVGNLLGTPPGLVIAFTGFPGDTSATGPGGTYGQGGQAIQLADGSVKNSTNTTVYTVARSDGTWFVKYIGIPSGVVFTIKDGSGAYSSPVYRYTPTGGNDFVVDTTSTGDWPAVTNFYPATLYINGQLATLDSSSEIDMGGAGTSYGGSVTYRVQPDTGDTFDIDWNWAGSGFVATVTGSFESFSSFTGTWNGIYFASLPNGLVVSAQAPPSTARYGPQQIVWNGVQLTLNGLASSVTSSNPTGSDIYQDSLGLSLQVAVASNGNVTVHQSDGTVLTGTYNASTQQFQFSGTAVGSLKAANSQGFAYQSGGQTPTLTQDTTDIAGNLDIHGNLLSLGNWTDTSGNSVDAFTLDFVNAQNNQPNVLNFAAIRQSTEWVWSHAVTDQGSDQVVSMVLSPTHALQLYSPTNTTTPTIVLDPGGKSHIEPQGDLSMGEFTQQPQ